MKYEKTDINELFFYVLTLICTILIIYSGYEINVNNNFINPLFYILPLAIEFIFTIYVLLNNFINYEYE